VVFSEYLYGLASIEHVEIDLTQLCRVESVWVNGGTPYFVQETQEANPIAPLLHMNLRLI